MIQEGEVLNQKKTTQPHFVWFFMECFIRKRGDWMIQKGGGTQPKNYSKHHLVMFFVRIASSESELSTEAFLTKKSPAKAGLFE